MADPAVTCGGCGAGLPREALAGLALVVCSCGTASQVAIYPAFFTAEIHGDRPSLRGSDDASCFYHPDKKAHVPCDACGRFLCTLCDIQMGDQHVCPACLESERQEGAPRLETERVLHDSVTLTLAVAPITMWPLTIFTAPVALFRAIRDFNKPASLVRRARWRLALAALLALAQVVGWGLLAFEWAR